MTDAYGTCMGCTWGRNGELMGCAWATHGPGGARAGGGWPGRGRPGGGWPAAAGGGGRPNIDPGCSQPSASVQDDAVASEVHRHDVQRHNIVPGGVFRRQSPARGSAVPERSRQPGANGTAAPYVVSQETTYR